ncbi:MAG: hypothetical protein JXR41_13995 [Bacteroidales bacterium]|nr:hypothetical protein [Bacteroidales bacterium]MBN2764200.1 hypothetical protein [Bacteroidales bacterium]
METLKHIKHGALQLMLVIAAIMNGSGQESNTLYFMKGVPQSYHINPATQPGCRAYLGLPVASPFQLFVENSAFSLEDVIFPLGDSLVTFMHPDADKEDFLSNLAPVNNLQLCVTTNLGSFGARRGDVYYTFDFSEKLFTRFSYNDDLLNFLLKGNQRGDYFNFSNVGVDFTSYFEYANGMSRIVNDRLTIGSRVKLIFGHANVTTKIKDVSLLTEEDWTVNSAMDLRISLPGIEIPTDENGAFEAEDIVFDDEIDPIELLQSSFGNVGLGLDIGMHYTLSDKLTLSASLLDLAGIRWSANTHVIHQDASYVYKGIEIDPGDTTAIMDNFVDSLSSTFSFTADENPYYTMLPVKLFVGGHYQIIDQIGVGILLRTEYYKKRLREQLTLSANFSPLEILALSLSYTIMNNTYNNFGFGLSSRLGPFNLYLVSDNIPMHYAVEQSSQMLIPYQARVMNLRIGLNLVFGCGEVRRKLRDLPLVY